MNPDAVENVGHQLKNQASEINNIVSQLNNVVSSMEADWWGPDAQTFCNDWWPKHKQELTQAATNIDGLGQSALNNASEQRQVSGH